MALKAVLSSLDGLPADIAKEYKAASEGGKFVLDVEAVEGVELADTVNLKKALSTERASVSKLTAQVKKFDGIDPDKAKTALEKWQEIENWNPDKKLDEAFKSREQQLLAKHQQEVAARDTKLKSITSQLENKLVVAAATEAIAGLKGKVKLLLPHVRASTRMRELDNGQYIAEVIDESGNVRIGDSSGSPMTIAQLVAEMKASDEFASAFEAVGQSGSGSANNNRQQSSGGGAKKTINLSDKAGMSDNLEAIASGEITVVAG